MTTTAITQLPDPLTELLRSGAQRLIEQAVEAELAVLLEAYASDKTQVGRARLVRHGHLPEREVITGIGAVPVKVPRVRDRGDDVGKVTSRKFGSPRQSCRPACTKPNLSRTFCPGFISRVFPPATFTKRSPHCPAPMPQGFLQVRYRGAKPIGGMSMTVGNGAI